MKRVICTAGFILAVVALSTAKNDAPADNSSTVKGMYPAYIEYKPGNLPDFKGKVSFITDEATAKIQPENFGSKQVNTETDLDGTQHIRYQQTLKGIAIENAYYIVHVQNGKVMMQNGKFVKDISISMQNTAPFITESSALQTALNFVNAKVYKWQISSEEALLKQEEGSISATYYPKATLVYYSGEEDVIPAEMRLAYKFNIYAAEPLSRQFIYVDAKNGKILGSSNLIQQANATGTAITGYSGTQTITTDSYNGSYRLRETGRGSGIQTFNLKKGSNYAGAADFTDADNTWNNVNTAKDQYATDAHFGAEKTYDFYWTNFGRNSINNAGFLIKSYVHYSTNYFNAFWDGQRMTYGDGDGAHGSKPLTALDVCGHEITHGLTSNTAKLNYNNEPGALNEGFSDIFGTCIEWYARPSNADWFIGKDFFTIRSMSNPNGYGQPDTYKGTKWIPTGNPSIFNDYGGVHTNSGVLNYWFYLLTQGGKGKNDKGFNFNVSGIGMAKAQAIAYRTLTVYLISTSKFIDARTYSIKAAQDLYGANSNEVTQVINAWNAVGVGGGTSPAGRYENPEAVTETEKVISKQTQVYPNPAKSFIHVDFYTATAGSSSISLVDFSGKVAFEQNIDVTEGDNSVQLNLPTLSKGTYIVLINGKTESKLVITE